jgi:hypothetical protein
VRVARTVLVLGLASSLLASTALGRATARIGSAGVTIALPAGWHSIPLANPPGLRADNDPVTRIVAASGSVSFGSGCGEFPYAFPKTAVALVVLEWTRPTRGVFPHRPRRFTSKVLPVRPAPAVECFAGPAGSVEFADHGRRFDAFVLLGRRASPALADRARSALNSLLVAARR